MPFALRYIENRVNRAVCCAVCYCVYVWGWIRFPSPTPVIFCRQPIFFRIRVVIVGSAQLQKLSSWFWRRPIFLAFLLSTIAAHAQPVQPDLYNGLKWRLIGPFRGGRVVAVAGVPGDSTTFYFGSVNGGVWKTVDAGVVWTPITDGQDIASIGALAVAPSDANVIYAGTGESDIRSDLSSGNGVYKSTDA